MPAQKLDLTLYDNDTLTLRLSIKSGTAKTPNEALRLPEFELDGWGALLQIRKSAASTELLAEISTPALPGHTGSGIEVSEPRCGELVLTFSHTLVTDAMLLAKTCEYDLLLIHPSGRPYRTMFGFIMAKRGVSRLSPLVASMTLALGAGT